jgi:hypothetical protein
MALRSLSERYPFIVNVFAVEADTASSPSDASSLSSNSANSTLQLNITCKTLPRTTEQIRDSEVCDNAKSPESQQDRDRDQTPKDLQQVTRNLASLDLAGMKDISNGDLKASDNGTSSFAPAEVDTGSAKSSVGWQMTEAGSLSSRSDFSKTHH